MSALDFLFIPVTVIYFLVVTTLFIYGLNFLYLSYHAWKRRDALTSEPLPLKTESLPFVTVQLPIYNELYVAERLIEAAAALDYPPSRFEIQVLDDSTDETVSLVARSVDRIRARGIQIHHLHRTDRQGFKAGALAHGLQTARGEFIAVFDADFVPRPDFLKRLLPYFDADDIAFVQARWGHLNGGYSLLTFLQSLSLDAHFAVEQLARSQLGLWFNFNGTAGIWRKSAIVDSGGWKAETLTEDLDLSYRAYLRGWRARYAGEVEAPSELPVSFTAFRRQQHRWAHGGFDCAVRYIPQIWKSDATLARKIQASLHLTGYLIHLLLFACVFLYPLVVHLRTLSGLDQFIRHRSCLQLHRARADRIGGGRAKLVTQTLVRIVAIHGRACRARRGSHAQHVARRVASVGGSSRRLRAHAEVRHHRPRTKMGIEALLRQSGLARPLRNCPRVVQSRHGLACVAKFQLADRAVRGNLRGGTLLQLWLDDSSGDSKTLPARTYG